MQITQHDGPAQIVTEILTDNSRVYNVAYVDPATADKLTFLCRDLAGAIALAVALNESVCALEIDQVVAS